MGIGVVMFNVSACTQHNVQAEHMYCYGMIKFNLKHYESSVYCAHLNPPIQRISKEKLVVFFVSLGNTFLTDDDSNATSVDRSTAITFTNSKR